MPAPTDKTDPFLTSQPSTALDPYATVPPTPRPGTEADATIPPPSEEAQEGTTDPWSTLPPAAGGAPSRSRQLKIAPKVSIPGYDVLRELGRGGMGVVYLARQKGLDRMVALKMILSGDHASSQQALRFHAEAVAISRLQHPNLVQIYEVGENEGRPYFSLEFVDGGTLQDKFRGMPQPPKEAARLVEVLARAVHYAHQRGIVHRDLKPANVLMTLDGTPKITDFGLAKRLDSDEGHTASGVIMGTPCYMAPEQAAGRIDLIAPATDVYALGAMLYEFLTGRPPLMAASDWETIRQVLEQEPIPTFRLQPKVPRDLNTICLKCLEKEPAKRYASAEELADDLQRFLDDEPIHARPIRPWERAWKWARRRPTFAALLLVSVVALCSFGAYERQAWKQQEKDSERLDNAREEVRQMASKARYAIETQGWTEAESILLAAQEKIKSEPGLTGQAGIVSDLLTRVRHRLQAEEQQRKFYAACDAAYFQAVLWAGDPTVSKVNETQVRVKEALKLVGLTPEVASEPVLGAGFRDEEKKKIGLDCYEMRLIYSETLASIPGHSPEKRREHARDALRVLDTAEQCGRNTRAFHLRRARFLKQAGDDAAARVETSLAEARANVKESDPAIASLDHYLVGIEMYIEEAVPDEAIREFNAVLRIDPDNFWARYLLSICYIRLGQHHMAKSNLTACLAHKPDVIWVYLMRGFAEGQLQEFSDAQNDFQTAMDLLEKKPDDDTRYALYNNRGVMRFRQPGKYLDGVEDLQRAILLRPKRYEAYVSLGEAYHQNNKKFEALVLLNQAISIATTLVKNRDLPPETLALLYRTRARRALENKEIDSALADFQTAIDLEPVDKLPQARAYTERARIMHLDHRFQGAEWDFVRALQIQRKMLEQVNNEESPDKEALLRKVKSEIASTQRWYAEALLAMKDYAAAVRALEEYEQFGGRRSAQVYRERGMARAILGQSTAAIDDFTRALTVEPNDAATYVYRGQQYLTNRYTLLARHDFDEAIRLKPDDLDAYIGRGTARARLDLPYLAVGDADELVKRQPKDPDILRNAARIYALSAQQLDIQGGPAAGTLTDRDRFRRRSVRFLEQAVNLQPVEERGAFWRKSIAPDAAYEGIRQLPDYVALDRAYNQPAPGKRPAP